MGINETRRLAGLIRDGGNPGPSFSLAQGNIVAHKSTYKVDVQLRGANDVTIEDVDILGPYQKLGAPVWVLRYGSDILALGTRATDNRWRTRNDVFFTIFETDSFGFYSGSPIYSDLATNPSDGRHLVNRNYVNEGGYLLAREHLQTAADFSSISIGSDVRRLTVSVVGSGTSDPTSILMRFNGDTGTNYEWWQRYEDMAGTITRQSLTGHNFATVARFGDIMGRVDLSITLDRSDSAVWQGQWMGSGGTTTTDRFLGTIGGYYVGAVPTSLEIFATGTETFKADSYIEVTAYEEVP